MKRFFIKKNELNNFLLTPKFLLRYAPGNMRKNETKF